ncbi:NAD-dependent epimerase/dehydratase family protein [Methylobacterium organophilum]|uniref:Aurachin B dehydrogenase n=1 Tax=Methylobacterium organophilum TaxID=410 RepID=A0ABQ4TC60_METOR|nr:NAD(P)-dependent oxidoreductase [Methylobacterium organophilum]GJE27917.1 Aurachin B dehydrogenase [Methylobacterium organophilum]
MTILLTGATGLVGARLLPRLLDAGLDCRALIRGSGYTQAGATTVLGDLFADASLVDAVQGITAVVHLAASFRTLDTDLVWRSNLDGTRNLVAAVRINAPEARFIMASTTNVYGANSVHPGREEDTVAPEAAYPASKLAAEQTLRDSGLNWSILRLGFVYGDGDGHLEDLPKHVPRFGWHPAQRMSTVHHRDVATAVLIALRGGMDRRTVNIVDDAPLSIYELVTLAGGNMEPSAALLENPWNMQADGTLARSLGFQPVVRTIYQAVAQGLL